MAARFKNSDAPEAGNYFREWREWREWTQQELADRMGTSKQQVSRVETGDRDWGKGYLEAFAFAIGCRAGDPISRPPPHASPAQFSDLMDVLWELDPNQVGQLLSDLKTQPLPAHAPVRTSASREKQPTKER
jgi:transcriptional regulator with XRE-family HTH domain